MGPAHPYEVWSGRTPQWGFSQTMDVREAVFISPLPGGAWDNRKVGSVWEEPPAGGLPRTTPNLNILMARVSAMTEMLFLCYLYVLHFLLQKNPDAELQNPDGLHLL